MTALDLTEPQVHEPEAQLRELVRALAERNAQLQRALTSRVVIEQAKGVLAERFGVTPDEAFELLRRAARSNRRPIHGLAADVVGSRVTPAEIAGVAEPALPSA